MPTPKKNRKRDIPPTAGPSPAVLWTSGILALMLMAFSITMWQLENDTLAGYSGLAAIALVGDIVRRLLGISTSAHSNHATASYETTAYETIAHEPAAPAPETVAPLETAPPMEAAPPALPQEPADPSTTPSVAEPDGEAV